jgi:hypothetical protein
VRDSALVCLPSENTDRKGDDRCSGPAQLVVRDQVVGEGAGAGRSRRILEQGSAPHQQVICLELRQVDPEGGAGQQCGESPQRNKHRYSGDPEEQQKAADDYEFLSLVFVKESWKHCAAHRGDSQQQAVSNPRRARCCPPECEQPHVRVRAKRFHRFFADENVESQHQADPKKGNGESERPRAFEATYSRD